MSDRELRAELAEGHRETRRRRAVKIGTLVGLVLGIVAAVAVHNILYGPGLHWGRNFSGSAIGDIIATVVFFPVVFPLNASYWGPLRDAPDLLFMMMALLLSVFEGAAIGKLISLRFRARS